MSDLARSGGFRFTASFILSCIGLYAVLNLLPQSFMQPVNEHVAATLGLVLNACGIPAQTIADVVSENGIAFRIIPECTPLFTTGLFLSFVAFHPATMKQKAVGLAMAIPALYLGNLARLALTFAVSRHDRRFFEIFHVYLGQIFTMILVIGACILWLKWINRDEANHSGSGRAAWFLARFALFSSVIFLVWLRVHHWYIRFLDWFMVKGFSLFDRQVQLARQTIVYYETFSIVIVFSLVLATWSVPWRRKLPLLGAGLGSLFMIHLIHRIDNALMAWFKVTSIQSFDLTSLVIGQYLVPILVLLYLMRLQRQEAAANPSLGIPRLQPGMESASSRP